MKDILLIVAAGSSTRFGGFPKAFVPIGKETNAARTARLARPFFDGVWMGVSHDTARSFGPSFQEGTMIPITPGQGDAHSLLKCLMRLEETGQLPQRVFVCWGDAVFLDGRPFEILKQESQHCQAAVACAMDEAPYAWLDTDENGGVLQAHFAREEGNVLKGLHDQSLFMLDTASAVPALQEYRRSLGIPMDNQAAAPGQREMKLLHFLGWLSDRGPARARAVSVPAGLVLSFNTRQEYEQVCQAALRT